MTGAALATDICPRCGGAFHCGVSDLAPCACTGLPLSAETLAGLRRRYAGCLCVACLVQLAPAGAATGFDATEVLTGGDPASDSVHRP